MDRLVPFESLKEDYYVGDTIRDGGGHADSDDGDSSDDEVQTALKEIAGYGPEHNCMGEKTRGKTEFEQEMDDELDDRMSDYVRATMHGEAAKGVEGEEKKKDEDDVMEEDADMPPLEDHSDGEGEKMITSPVKSSIRTQKRRSSEKAKEKGADDIEMTEEVEEKKKVKFAEPEAKETTKKEEEKEMEPQEEEYSSSSEEDEEGETNPIKAAARKVRKEAREAGKKEKSAKTLPDFYNPSEDDDNEEWVQERRRSSQGKKADGRKVNPKQIRLEDGSDAVLSCPGCMVLLTRDCQRHETYKEQYRAMFVENCRTDEEEQLTIEKTGKEKRRERQKRRKEGGPVDMPTDGDLFKAVRCAVCTTKVAVIDHDEVYHFFNVLAGYS